MTNIGTIPDESFVTVKVGNQVIGKIDEGFLEKLKSGDVFILGGTRINLNFLEVWSLRFLQVQAGLRQFLRGFQKCFL